MQLALTVFFAVLAMTVFVALVGYLIDKSAEGAHTRGHERKEGR